MRLVEVKPKETELPTSKKVKVYKRGRLNLSKLFLKALEVNFEGGEVIAEVFPSEGKVVLRRAPRLGQLPKTDLKGFSREEAYLLRGAIPEAREFFQNLEKALKEIYPNLSAEIEIKPRRVSLKMGKLRLTYKESPSYPEGVITLKANEEKILLTNPKFSKKEAFLLGYTLADLFKNENRQQKGR